jgi:hypothetical protein
MCSLVQAIRKIGIVGGGPGIGDAANPMHIIRSVESATTTSSTTARPSTSGSSDFDPSFGQRRRAVEDPSTRIEDDTRLPEEMTYYTEENLQRHLPREGTEGQETAATGLQVQPADVTRGKSFGKRKRQVQGDLEKGPQSG